MRRKKLFGVMAGVALGALTLSACGGGSAAPSEPETSEEGDAGEASGAGDDGGDDGPLKVIVFGGVGAEGVLANNANTSVTAAQASAKAVNDAGGILGRQIELVLIDDTADPTVAVTKLREELAKGDPIIAATNSGPSTIADATIPILTEEKILSFNIGPTADSADPSVHPYNFDMSPSPADYIRGFLPTMKDEGYEKVAIIHGSSAYSETFGAMAEDIFSEEGFEITGVQGFDNEALDMTGQIDSLMSGDPDLLVMDAYGAPTTYVLEGVEKLGWDIPILANNSVSASPATSTEPPTGLLGTDRVKNLRMQVFHSTVFDPSDEQAVAAVELMAETGPIESTLILGYNYDTMWLLKAAAEDAGSFDVEALTASLEKTEVQEAAETVILKKYNFTADGHSAAPAPEEFRFVAPSPVVNGQFQG